MTDEKVVQLEEKYRSPLGWFGENVRAAIREAYDVGRRDTNWVSGKVRLPKSGREVIVLDSGRCFIDYIDPEFGNWNKFPRTDYNFLWLDAEIPTDAASISSSSNSVEKGMNGQE